MLVSALTERELIARVQEQLPQPPSFVLAGIGDDGAVVEPERNRVEVLTVDAIVEGVHFDRRFTPPDAIGHRALAVNLSDLAAMGASPRLALLSCVLPATLRCAEFDEIVRGIAALAAAYRVHVVGGNLTRSPGPLMIDVTAVGFVKRRDVLTRCGARAGDEVYVTGTVGAAAAGLQMLQGRISTTDQTAHVGDQATPANDRTDSCIRRYLYPQARVRTGELLGRNRAASACMDLSDGLADGVRQLASLSGVGIRLDGNALPIEAEARTWFESQGVDPIERAIAGGDDYELVFTARPRLRGRLTNVLRHGGTAFTRIGVCTKEPDVLLCRTVAGAATEQPLPDGFDHFR